jgi:tRNA(Ile)-lysidine synthetase, N-terminal domain
MIKILGQLPEHFYLAFSGGVDSLAAAHFLKNGKKKFALAHFHHGCEYSNDIATACWKLAEGLGIKITVGYARPDKKEPGQSLEQFWRAERYEFFKNMASPEAPIVTCHHLDDAVESWVWSSLHGKPHVIKPVTESGNVIRPFLLTEKAEFQRYAYKHGLTPVPDPYNSDLTLTRNYIRSNIIPHAYHVNPGLKKVIRKKYL